MGSVPPTGQSGNMGAVPPASQNRNAVATPATSQGSGATPPPPNYQADNSGSEPPRKSFPLIPVLIVALVAIVAVAAIFLIPKLIGGSDAPSSQTAAQGSEAAGASAGNSSAGPAAAGETGTNGNVNTTVAGSDNGDNPIWGKRSQEVMDSVAKASEDHPLPEDFLVGTWVKYSENLYNDGSSKELSTDSSTWNSGIKGILSFRPDGLYQADFFYLKNSDARLVITGSYGYTNEGSYEKFKTSPSGLNVTLTVDNIKADEGAPAISDDRKQYGFLTGPLWNSDINEYMIDIKDTPEGLGDWRQYFRKLNMDYAAISGESQNVTQPKEGGDQNTEEGNGSPGQTNDNSQNNEGSSGESSGPSSVTGKLFDSINNKDASKDNSEKGKEGNKNQVSLDTEKDADDYDPRKEAISGGSFETLQSGEVIYTTKNGDQAANVWVEDGGKYYYIDYTGCLMHGNYSAEGFWVQSDGSLDESAARLREVAAPRDSNDYGTDPSWHFTYVKNADDSWDVTAKRTYSFGHSEEFKMEAVGRCNFILRDKEGTIVAQFTVVDDHKRIFVTEAGNTSIFDLQE